MRNELSTSLSHTGIVQVVVACPSDHLGLLRRTSVAVIADLRDEDHASVTLARSVATIIEKATENGLTIASVVSDSAACMIHCIDLDNIESDSHYTRFVSQPLSWRPFHSQCAAHLLHNAYRDAVGLSPLLRSIHTFVENLVNECRAVRYKSNFSRKPPRFLAHRWISISSLVLWVYQESKKLTELFPDQFTAQRQFEVLILYHLVIPLFQTVSYLESDQRSLSDVLPAVFQLLLHYEALTVLLQEHHQVWIPPTRTCEDCVFCRIVQTDSAMLRALAFSFTPFGRHVMTGIPFDRMKEIASYPASSPIEFIPLPTPSQLSLDEKRDLPDLTNLPTPIQIRTEGRRQAAIHQETHLQQTLIDLGPDIGEYFETGESEDGDSGVEEDYTPAQREMRQKSTLSQAGNKTIKEATIQVLRYELEYTQRFDDTSQDIPIQKVKRRCSSADYSQSDIIGKQSQLERLLEETIGEEHDSDDSADSDEYQTCRTVIGETQWKHLLCVQLGLTIRQSIPGLDPKSILCVQANYLAWLNHLLTLPFDCLFETKPYMYWKNNRDSSNIIVQTLSTVAVCMLSTAATEACCERLFSQMRTLIGSHRSSFNVIVYALESLAPKGRFEFRSTHSFEWKAPNRQNINMCGINSSPLHDAIQSSPLHDAIHLLLCMARSSLLLCMTRSSLLLCVTRSSLLPFIARFRSLLCMTRSSLLLCVTRSSLLPFIARFRSLLCMTRSSLLLCMTRSSLLLCVTRPSLLLCMTRSSLLLCVTRSSLLPFIARFRSLLCMTRSSLLLCVTRSSLLLCMTRSSLLLCVTRSSLLLCMTRSSLLLCVTRSSLLPFIARFRSLLCMTRSSLLLCVTRSSLLLCMTRSSLLLCMTRSIFSSAWRDPVFSPS
ncbi:putative Stress protein DDR48 [Blattamonas nauphoetae]|uniref:Stress protein DDR48 n=1 Tax=Blattamonas nauphoetae TaxID=2049346 RepID=A0ABQ9YK06_9EUKA|nr:putative Stress protein DDR48 [Blattamonas nauphoetae]